eukprot:symbB.v1.2.004535.t1/scaffold256.1/size249868/6
MVQIDGALTPEMQRALDTAFDRCTGQGVMSAEDTEAFLMKINRQLGRGSEFRFVEKVFEAKGKRELSREDFHALYSAELAEGKFWGVEHDLRELTGTGMAQPSDGPCELRFDYIYFTENLKLLEVKQMLTPTQMQQIYGEPFETLPNSWHPSDHLPVIASFEVGLFVRLDEEQWKERFSEHEICVESLRKIGHQVRFGVDARQEDCAKYSMVMFNFPAVSMQDCKDDKDFKPEKAGCINGDLVTDFLKNAQATSDVGTLLVLGLWGRCDGLADRRLYGQDSHELVATALAECDEPAEPTAAVNGRRLEDALTAGFLRSGIHADYSFYKPYNEEGYAFRSSSGAASFESSHKEWHLQACFVLRVVATGEKERIDRATTHVAFDLGEWVETYQKTQGSFA